MQVLLGFNSRVPRKLKFLTNFYIIQVRDYKMSLTNRSAFHEKETERNTMDTLLEYRK